MIDHHRSSYQRSIRAQSSRSGSHRPSIKLHAHIEYSADRVNTTWFLGHISGLRTTFHLLHIRAGFSVLVYPVLNNRCIRLRYPRSDPMRPEAYTEVDIIFWNDEAPGMSCCIPNLWKTASLSESRTVPMPRTACWRTKHIATLHHPIVIFQMSIRLFQAYL